MLATVVIASSRTSHSEAIDIDNVYSEMVK